MYNALLFYSQSLDSAIASHEPTVLSLNEAAQKLVASSTAENTAEIEQDITDLNERYVSSNFVESLTAKGIIYNIYADE